MSILITYHLTNVYHPRLSEILALLHLAFCTSHREYSGEFYCSSYPFRRTNDSPSFILRNISRNILGGNFALVGLPSVGASGAIFGTVGVLWVDLLAHWGLEKQPGKKVRFS